MTWVILKQSGYSWRGWVGLVRPYLNGGFDWLPVFWRTHVITQFVTLEMAQAEAALHGDHIYILPAEDLGEFSKQQYQKKYGRR